MHVVFPKKKTEAMHKTNTKNRIEEDFSELKYYLNLYSGIACHIPVEIC